MFLASAFLSAVPFSHNFSRQAVDEIIVSHLFSLLDEVEAFPNNFLKLIPKIAEDFRGRSKDVSIIHQQI